MRRSAALVVASLFAGLGVAWPSGIAHAASDAAEQAAREIEATRQRAAAAAEAWARAEDEYEAVLGEIEQLQHDKAAAEQRLGELRSGLRDVALRRYVNASAGAGALFGADTENLVEQVQADALVRFFTQGSNEVIDDYRVTAEDLEYTNQVLAAKKVEAEGAVAAMEATKRALDEQVVALQEAEQRRLADEAIQRALEARRAAEQERIAREEEQRRNEQPATSAPGAAPTAPGTKRPATTVPPAGKPATPNPPTTKPPATAPPSGGGPGNSKPPAGKNIWGGPGWRCPVAGPSAFVDTWGAPRSGGRRHQGVDMISPRGTPLVAVVSGTVTQKQNRLGGLAIYLRGDDGHVYYYAHLDTYGAAGRVSAGDQVGTVGDTGNARGVPHLHFEIKPFGGASVNPYPTVRAFC